ncbi:MAG: AAA family ATPase [Planctomycetales bacterium]|nr:AAA family ATPase [Planctomycetales bacterium]
MNDEANQGSHASESLIEQLRSSLQRADSDQPVELLETHISWVLLTRDRALKIKKPVRFDFLDFSTLDLRRQFCEEEVRLNRRLAADVYLGLLGVAPGANGPELRDAASCGESALEWAVEMRRLPEELSLDNLIENDSITPEQTRRVAERLATFYRGLSNEPVGDDEYRGRLESLVRNNRNELLEAKLDLPDYIVHRIHAAQLQYLELSPEFTNRAAVHVVDGHGDLRPEHIYATDVPVVIDCLEFNASMRRVDTADELAFLEMECEALGAGDVGATIANLCFESLGDRPSDELLSFYKSYRACVRGKVAELRSQQLSGESAETMLTRARRYLELANRYVDQFARPLLLVVRGLSGTGKSTMAETIADAFGAPLLQTDVVRRELQTPGASGDGYGEGDYTEARRLAVYDRMLAGAVKSLEVGRTVVLDGTFLKRSLRRRAANLASSFGAEFLVVNCQCPTDIVKERIRQRRAGGDTLSDARPELLDAQRADEEPVSPDLPQLNFDTSAPLDECRTQLLHELRARFAAIH